MPPTRTSNKARSFTFTKNNYTDDDVNAIRELCTSAKFAIFGYEVGESGTPHLQGYIQFPNPRALRSVVSLGLGHVEVARGSPQQNIDYCSKSGQVEEFGTKPRPGKRSDLERVRDALKNEDLSFDALIADHISVTARYPNFVEKLKRHYHPPTALEGQLHDHNLWVYGPPGVGKTVYAKGLGEHYIKMPNKWFDGYEGQPILIVEDIGPDQCKMLQHFLKIWGDYSPFTAQVKNSSKYIRPQRVIITSNYSIDEMGLDMVTTGALKRRYKALHMPEPLR